MESRPPQKSGGNFLNFKINVMTPQEKAEELIEKYITQDIAIIAKCDNSTCIPSGCMTYISAIGCAIIAVDEIIKIVEEMPIRHYYHSVKQELIKLKQQ